MREFLEQRQHPVIEQIRGRDRRLTIVELGGLPGQALRDARSALIKYRALLDQQFPRTMEHQHGLVLTLRGHETLSTASPPHRSPRHRSNFMADRLKSRPQ